MASIFTKAFWSKKQPETPKQPDAPSQNKERSYREIVSVGGENSDWAIGDGTLSHDSAIWQNIFLLRSRMRDLFRSNPYFQIYKRSICSNVIGDRGIMLTMEIKETEDRVVHADEKWMLIQHERRINRVREWAARKTGADTQVYRAFHLADALERSKPDDILRGTAMVRVGAPDLFANLMIEQAWKEWQRKEFCDVKGMHCYNKIRMLRLISACRDGDIFIQRIKDPRVNKFGYAIRLVNSEWCDYWYNIPRTTNGNEIRMGIEYQVDSFGANKPVAYHFIRRMPGDWQFAIPGAFNFSQGTFHDRVPADEIIHYAPVEEDADSTRPAPWGCASIPKARQLDMTELAHVEACRTAACKMGWFTSSVVPEGGLGMGDMPDPTKLRGGLQPGMMQGLPYGIKPETFDPNFPNANFPEFRKAMLRSFCAANPGASYAVIGHDYESINFSAGRLDRLATTGDWRLMQQDDIDLAERTIFEDFLEMSLITGAIPLPFTKDKFRKLNRPHFQPRRWEGVDEVKEVTAAALRIANNMSSHTKECAERGVDFEKNAFQKAEDMMLMEELGLDSSLTVQSVKSPAPAEDVSDDPEGQEGDGESKPEKPKSSKKSKGKDRALDLHINGVKRI